MSSYKDLEIYTLAFDLAFKIHKASLKLPQFELYEQGSQVGRSSKSVKDQIVEGLEGENMIEFKDLITDCDILGKKLNSFINYVENNWRT